MKKFTLTIFLMFALTHSTLYAHNIWVETNPVGTQGQSHLIEVFYGEYSYDYYESVDENFKDVENFKLWVIGPNGQQTALKPTAGETKYTAHFTPDASDTYTVVVSSTEGSVVDWREYDMGVLKPHFFASSTVAVGSDAAQNTETSSKTTLSISRTDNADGLYTTGDTALLAVNYNGEPLKEQEIVVSIAGQWSKTIVTDNQGIATLKLPWASQYILEAVYREEIPGSYDGTQYEAVRHVATHTLKVQ